MTDGIMCQKIYGQGERASEGGEEEWSTHFLAPTPPPPPPPPSPPSRPPQIIVFSGVPPVF